MTNAAHCLIWLIHTSLVYEIVLYYLIILFDHQIMKITDSLRFLRDQNPIMNEALYENIMAIERVSYVSFSMCCWC